MLPQVYLVSDAAAAAAAADIFFLQNTFFETARTRDHVMLQLRCRSVVCRAMSSRLHCCPTSHDAHLYFVANVHTAVSIFTFSLPFCFTAAAAAAVLLIVFALLFSLPLPYCLLHI